MRHYGYLIAALLIGLLALAGCTAAPASPAASTEAAPPTVAPTEPAVPSEPAAEPEAEPEAEAEIVLTVAGPDKEIPFTMEELQALPATSGQAGMKSSTGKITVPGEYKGVLLTDLLELVGGLSPEYGVNVVANDGYAMTLSYDQITKGSFITYDPSDGSEKTIDDPLRALVAYEFNGEPLDERRDGRLRLVIISDKNNQVTDGHWAIKWTERIEVQPLVMEWNLSLDGVRDEIIDRNTFQSCGAASCHQETWTDAEGQVWSGVPLYLLAGRMDDDISHEGPAYNRELAGMGYLIELVAADGYTITIDSQTAYYNRQIFLANLVDDSALPEKYFPLRLVGEDVEKGQQIGAVTEIRLLLDEQAAAEEPAAEEAAEPPAAEEATGAETAAEPPEGTVLWITGKVANPLALNEDGIRAFQVVQVSAEHPKRGVEDYEGVPLQRLIALTAPLEAAKTVVLTAADGYSTSIDLAAVLACEECLVAFTDTEGSYNLAMPGFESSAWVKDIAKIEVQ